MKYARLTNFDQSIKNLLKRNGCYVGVSAGSIILGQSIDIASELCADPNDVGLTDMRGFNLIPYIILPHYTPKSEVDISKYEDTHMTKVERLSDGNALIITDKHTERI